MHKKYCNRSTLVLIFLTLILLCATNSAYAKNIQPNKFYDLTLDEKDQNANFTFSIPEKTEGVMLLKIKSYKPGSKYVSSVVSFDQDLKTSSGELLTNWDIFLDYDKDSGSDDVFTNDTRIFTNPNGYEGNEIGYYYEKISDGNYNHNAVRSNFKDLEKGQYSIDISDVGFARYETYESDRDEKPFSVTVQIGLCDKKLLDCKYS